MIELKISNILAGDPKFLVDDDCGLGRSLNANIIAFKSMLYIHLNICKL